MWAHALQCNAMHIVHKGTCAAVQYAHTAYVDYDVTHLRLRFPMPIVCRRECNSAELVLPVVLPAVPPTDGIRGFLSFQSFVVILLLIVDEAVDVLCVGLCDVTAMG